MRYAFNNWSDTPFTGRYSRIDYPFAPGETKDFDPDKHQMLIIMAKQLADRELLKGIAGVGKNPNDNERFGKALDANGNPFVMTTGDRKDLMRKAIGELVDTPLPVPADQVEEVGGTKETQADISQLQEQVKNLTEMVGSLVAKLGENPVNVPAAPAIPTAQTPPEPLTPENTPPKEPIAKPDQPATMNTTREILLEMATERGLKPTPEMTKEQLVELLNK